jgi:hypothetical protein
MFQAQFVPGRTSLSEPVDVTCRCANAEIDLRPGNLTVVCKTDGTRPSAAIRCDLALKMKLDFRALHNISDTHVMLDVLCVCGVINRPYFYYMQCVAWLTACFVTCSVKR